MPTQRSSSDNVLIPLGTLPDLQRALSYSLRLEIFRALAASPMHVDAIAVFLRRDASSISRHLGILHGVGLVWFRKVKKLSVYRISPRVVSRVQNGTIHVELTSLDGFPIQLSYPVGKAVWSDPAHEGASLHGRVRRIDG